VAAAEEQINRLKSVENFRSDVRRFLRALCSFSLHNT
jgi:hypothetical protein